MVSHFLSKVLQSTKVFETNFNVTLLYWTFFATVSYCALVILPKWYMPYTKKHAAQALNSFGWVRVVSLICRVDPTIERRISVFNPFLQSLRSLQGNSLLVPNKFQVSTNCFLKFDSNSKIHLFPVGLRDCLELFTNCRSGLWFLLDRPSLNFFWAWIVNGKIDPVHPLEFKQGKKFRLPIHWENSFLATQSSRCSWLLPIKKYLNQYKLSKK